MSASKPTLPDDIAQYHDQLDESLRDLFGMTYSQFRLIKAITQLIGTGAGVYAMGLGAEPLPTFVLMTIIILGPEGFETWLENAK